MVCSLTYAQKEIKFYESWICDRNHYEFGVICIFKNAKELKKSDAKKLARYFEVYTSDDRLEYAFMFVKMEVSKEILKKGDKDFPFHYPTRKFEFDTKGRVIQETIPPFAKKFQVWKTTYGDQRMESRGYDENGQLFSTWIAIYKDNWRIKKTAYIGPQEKYFGHQTYDHKTGIVKSFDYKGELLFQEKENFIK